MPIYDFQAKKPDGSSITGTVEARDREEVVALLLEKKLYPLAVRPKAFKLTSLNFAFPTRVKAKDLVVLSRQLAVMIEATVPLVQALKILIDQTSNVKLKSVVADLAKEVDGGAKFSEALEKHTKVFSDFYISMVKSGETSGRLDEVLNYLADQQEKDYDMMSKIRGAMIYPIFIVIGLIVVGFVMMIFVVPKLTAILTETGAELPLPTVILIAVSGFMQKYWYLVILFFIVAVLTMRVMLRSPKVKRQWDLWKLKIPIFGKLFQRIYLVRFTRSMVTLIQGGVPLPQALEITADVVGNKFYKDLILQTKKEVDDGNPLTTIFLESKEVPVMVSQMMSLGEETGRLDQVLDKLTAFYSREIENLVANLVSLIEPMIMVVMGIAVGGMVAAVIMPMYNLATGF